MKSYKLFYTPMCPKCPKVKDFMGGSELEKEWVDCSTTTGLDKAREHNVMAVPTVIFFDSEGKEVARATSLEEVKRVIENKTLV